MPNTPIQIVDNLALVPVSSNEVAQLNLQSLGVITVTSAGGGGDMLKSVFATINPGGGFVDKSISSQSVPYTGLTTLPGGTATFLRADGTFAAPPGQTYGVVTAAGSGLVPALPASSGFNYFFRGDGSWQLISSVSIGWTQITGMPATFTPSLHATQHITGGNDVIPGATTSKSGLVPILPSTLATTSYLRGDGTFSVIPITTAAASGLAPALSAITTQFLRGDGTWTQVPYGSLSGVPTTFTPIAHATQHITGGNDVIPNFAIGGATAGLAPGSPGGTVNYLRADGTWAAPPGGGGLATSSGAGLLNQLPLTNQTLYFLRGDNTFQLISGLSIAYTQITGVPVFAGGSAGLVPNSVGGTVNFLRADGTFAAPPGGALVTSSSPGLVATLQATAQTTYYLRGDDTWQLIANAPVSYTSLVNVPASFTPSAHATAHITAGTDVIPAPTITKSGLVPILPGTSQALNFLRGDATWAIIPGVTSTASGLVPAFPNTLTTFFRGDGTYAAIPSLSSTTAGLPAPFPGNTTTFLRGDGTWTTVAYTSLSSVPATFTPSAHASQHITAGNDIIPAFTATTSGLVPLSGGGTGNFLRADGTWQTPSGAGDVFHTRQILTTNSLTGGGDLSADRTLSFVNDVASPGNWSIYSTNGSGVRGWNASTAFPAATSTTAGLVPTPPANAAQFLNGTALFSIPPSFTATTPGYAPLSGGGTANFLRADGTWVAPPGANLATTSAAGTVPSLPATLQGNYFLRGDDTWQLISGMSIAYTQLTGVPTFTGTATAGLVPGSTGNAAQFLRGDGTWNVPPLSSSAQAGYISGLPALNNTFYYARGDNSWQFPWASTLVTSPWIMPAIGSTVSGVTVASSALFVVGMTVQTGTGSTASFMEVNTVTDSTHVVLMNRGYSSNPVNGTSIPGGLLTIVAPGVMTGTLSGLVPTPPNVTTQFLSGAGTWLTPSISGTVFTQLSVQGDGSSGNKIQLVNDAATPGAFQFYSTNAAGTKGWYPLTYSWETNASFVMPGVNATQNVTFVTNVGMTAGTTIVIEDSSTNQAFLEIVSVNADTIHAVLVNRGYTLNASGGTTFATNASVTLAGPGVSTSANPGFVPTPPGTTTTFLSGASTFITPPNVTTGAPGYVPTAPNITTQFLAGDGTWRTPTITTLASSGVQGAVVGLPASNQTTYFLRGDNSWQLFTTIPMPYSQLTGVPTTFTPSAHATQHITAGNDIIPAFTATASGLAPLSGGGTVNYLRADGTWQTPPSAGLATTSAQGLVPILPASAGTTYFLRGDNSWQLISSMSIAYTQLTGVPTTFTPSAHASTHLDNGTDPIAVVAGLRTGLVPVLPSAAPTTKFLRGDATWTVIPAVTSSAAGLVPAFDTNTLHFFRGDGTYAAVPTATATVAGLVPTPPNSTFQYFRGDATFVTLPLTWQITASFTQPATNGNVSVTFLSTTGLQAGMCIATVDSGNQANIYTVVSITNTTVAVLNNFGATGNTAAASTVNTGYVELSGPPMMTATSGGLVPISGGGTSNFLRADATWATPSVGVPTNRQVATQFSLTGGGDLSADRTLNLVNDTASPGSWFLYSTNLAGTRGWNASTALPVATTSNAGLLPTLTGNTSQFLNGNGAYAVPPGSSNVTTSASGTVNPLPSTNQTFQWLRADDSWQFIQGTNATTSSWTMPAIGSTVSAVPFVSTANFSVGQTLFFATGSSATQCFMEVNTVTDATHLVLTNRGYNGNPASTTSITSSLVFVASPGVATSTQAGLVPTPSGLTTQFLRGDATFATYPPYLTTSASFTAPAQAASVVVTVGVNTDMVVGQTHVITDGTNFINGTITNISGTSITYKNNGGTGAAVSGTIGAGHVYMAAMQQADGVTTHFLRGDNTYATPPSATATVAGYVPTPPNNTTTFLRGDATFNAVAYSSLSGTPSTFTPSAHASTHITGGSDLIPAPTTSATGIVPVLSASNNTNKWLRGDASWVSAPGLAITTALFNWPAVGSTVTVTVDTTSLMMVGGAVYIPTLGTAEITAVPTGTTVTLRNNGNTSNAGATSNVAVGTQLFAGTAGALATATSSGMIPTPPNNQTTFLRGDATFATPPNVTTSAPGYVPTAPNSTTQFLRGDATWATAIPNAGQATVNFGATDTGDDSVASVTVTATWINASSNFPTCAVVPGSDHADEDPWVEDIRAYIQNIVNGASFDIVLHAPTGAVGNYLVNYISN